MALPQPKIVYIGNTLVLELMDADGEGLRDPITGAYVNDAVVTARLKTAVGADIAGQTWPLTLAYVTGSRGVYRGALAATLVITDKQALVCVIDITRGSDVAHKEIPMIGAIRKK